MTFQYMPPGNIPQVQLNPSQLFEAAQQLTGLGGGIESTVASVNSTWQQLGSVYLAPETLTLTNALGPIQQTAQQIGTDLVAVSGALDSYASVLESVQLGLRAVQTEAIEQQTMIETYMAESAITGANPGVEMMITEQTEGMVATANSHLEQWETAEYECAEAIAMAAGTFGSTPQPTSRANQVRSQTGDVGAGMPTAGGTSPDVNAFSGAGAATAGGLGGASALAGAGSRRGQGPSSISQRLDPTGRGSRPGQQQGSDRVGAPTGAGPTGAGPTGAGQGGSQAKTPNAVHGEAPPAAKPSTGGGNQPPTPGGSPTSGGTAGSQKGPSSSESNIGDVLAGKASPTPAKVPNKGKIDTGTSELLDGWTAPARPASPVKPLTPSDRAQINDYTTHRFDELNSPLRNGTATPAVQARADALSGALAKFPAYKGTVVRGADLDQASLGRYVEGQVVKEKGFTSTTYANREFGGSALFVIKSRSGRDITDYSARKAEREVLFDQNTNFKVLRKRFDKRLDRWVIEMMEA